MKIPEGAQLLISYTLLYLQCQYNSELARVNLWAAAILFTLLCLRSIHNLSATQVAKEIMCPGRPILTWKNEF